MNDKAVFSTSDSKSREQFSQQEEITVQDPEIVKILSFKGVPIILSLLIEKEMTIIDLHNATKINPGTIKRHLKNLEGKGIILQTRIEQNSYGIKLKYYRSRGKKIKVIIEYNKKYLQGMENAKKK